MDKDEKKSDPKTDEPSNEALAALIEKLNERIDKLEKKLGDDGRYWPRGNKKKCPNCNGTGRVNDGWNPYDPYPHPHYQHYIP